MWAEVGSLIKDIGFPAFVALFVLIRLEPAIKRLDNSITTLTVVTAKSNGMKSETIAAIVEKVMAKRTGKHRRVTDVLKDDEKNGCA